MTLLALRKSLQLSGPKNRAVPPVGSGSRADDHRRRWSIYGLTFWELIGGKPSH